ncbi:MAG: Hsp70 family protein [Spirochaetales bacterium]|nr:Hsp70 family protein [Spirochaetales bacterium]
MALPGIGIDFGTSNTTVAVYDGQSITYLKLDTRTGKGSIMPTALYLDRDCAPSVGAEALVRCLEDNTGRKIVLSDKDVGSVTVHMGEMDRDYFIERDRTFTTTVTGKIDAELPGRLFRSMKSYLGDRGDQRFDVFGRKFRLEAILTIILRHVGQHISQQSAAGHQQVYIGRPVLYSGTSEDPSARALERMGAICSHAGLGDVSFLMEPEAAAISYLHSHEGAEGENVLVVDFGGGTLDLCIMTRENNRYNLKAVAGVPRAGDYIDRLIYRHKISPYLGAGLGSAEDFHFSEFEENLLNWQSTYLLNQSRYMEKINNLIKSGGQNAEKGRRLKKLIRLNGSFQLIELIEEAKIALSSLDETSIEMEEIDLSIGFSRSELKEILEPVFRDISTVVSEILFKARMGKENIDRVLCTGGSSRIPAVRQHLAELLGREPEEWESFRGIAAGLAVASYQGL